MHCDLWFIVNLVDTYCVCWIFQRASTDKWWTNHDSNHSRRQSPATPYRYFIALPPFLCITSTVRVRMIANNCFSSINPGWLQLSNLPDIFHEMFHHDQRSIQVIICYSINMMIHSVKSRLSIAMQIFYIQPVIEYVFSLSLSHTQVKQDRVITRASIFPALEAQPVNRRIPAEQVSSRRFRHALVNGMYKLVNLSPSGKIWLSETAHRMNVIQIWKAKSDKETKSNRFSLLFLPMENTKL